MKFPASALLAVLLTGSAPSGRADGIDDLVRAEMLSNRIPGAALCIIQGGKELRNTCYGFANLELAAPVTSNTVFEIGSVTKQFTAAGILLLQQAGKLSVEDRISLHLPDTPPAWTNITIRHLLTHTSGIKSYTGLDGFEWRRRLTQEQFIRAISQLPLEFQPGAAWKYSNTGYNLLGYIIENVSGSSYWQFLRTQIFDPTGMISTTDRNPASIIPNRAAGYEQTNHQHINRDYDITDVFAAGAMVTTTTDLAKWSAALESTYLLSSDSKKLMWTPQTLSDGKPTKYGLGWHIDSADGRTVIGHGGSTSGFSATIQRFPSEKLTVILLTNTDEAVATRLARKLADLHLGKRK